MILYPLVALAAAGRGAMLKRNYAHCKGIGRIEDNMIEDIEILSSHHKCRTCVDTIPQAQVHSLVGMAKINTLCSALNLRAVSRLIPNCRFDKQKFAAITIRIRNPMCTVLLFTSSSRARWCSPGAAPISSASWPRTRS